MDRKELKALIRERGYTYQTLADEIGVTLQAIAEIVAGRTTGAMQRYALAKALGVEVEDIWPQVPVEEGAA